MKLLKILLLSFMAVGLVLLLPNKPSACAAKWGSCGADNTHKACPANGQQIEACIDSVDIVTYVYDTVNVPKDTKITMFIGQPTDSCSDVTCLKRNDSTSLNWEGNGTSNITLNLDTIGCSGSSCRKDFNGRNADWIDVIFHLEKDGVDFSNCRAIMSARTPPNQDWLVPTNESEMRGMMDITGNNDFVREINVKFVCDAPPPPPSPKVCNDTCSGNEECQTGLTCSNGRCRLPANPSSTTCQPEVPLKTCNEACTQSSDCESNLTCSSGRCRLPANPSSTTCSPPISSCPVPNQVTNVKVSCPLCTSAQ